MSKKMLINALHAEEARVAIVEEGRLVELDVEIAGNEQIRGNIYKGVVVRVEPGLQAAFVDIGLKKLGFLQMGELHPENWKWRDDISEDQRHRRPRIQEVLRRGQELVVQVEKGERDNKGSALTTYVSLPGRYMVLMPGSDSSGISRKVESESERKKLKEIISEMSVPDGYGYIIRTEAVGRTRDELQKDFDTLVGLYQGVRAQGAEMKGAGLIYQESALFIRTIRDYFSSDIDEVLVDSKEVYKDVRECLRDIDPEFEKLVKLHQEKRPIFSRYQLEEQIDLIYEKKVPLKSGGSIFIEPTEALVSIDVNSGKSTGEKGVEDTAFKTNLEAAEEAARQLRLRDLGGLIVIDFIDMRDRKHNAEVEKTLKAALKADKARVNVARISEFGLLEMSRQRIRQTLNQASTLECPHCDGRGKVKSVESMALSFLRKVHAAAAKGTTAEVVGGLPLEVAYYLLNRKRRELAQIEKDYDIEVTVKGKPSFLLNQMEVEVVKREKGIDEQPQEKQPARTKEEGPQEAAQADGRKKKKKGKGKHAEAEAPAVAEVAPAVEVEEPAVSLEAPPVVEGELEEQKKKRRRKRKRGKGGGGDVTALEIAADAAAEAVEESAEAAEATEATEALASETPAGEHAGEEAKKKRRRKRRRGKGGGAEAVAGASEAPEEVAEVVDALTGVAAEPEPATAAAAQAESEATSAEPAAARPRSKSGSRRKKPASAEGEAPAAAAEPVAPQAEPVVAAAELNLEAAKPAKAAKAAKTPKAAKPAKEPKAVKEPKAAKEPKSPARSRKAKAEPEAQVATTSAPPAVEPAPSVAAEPAPKKRATKPKTKGAEPAAEAGAEPAVAPVAGQEPEAPKKKRAPRKKKEETPA